MESHLTPAALFHFSHRLRRALFFSFLLAICSVSGARAQANLAFSGGNGTPLTITLSLPVLYTITTASNLNAPLFDFQSAGNIFHGNPVSASGSITVSINGGASQVLSTLNSGGLFGSVQLSDLFGYGQLPGVSVGDAVELMAGTLTTTTNVAAAPPANGSYQTFLIDDTGTKLDAVNGIAVVPEPSSLALAVLGGGGLLLPFVRRLHRA